MVRCCATDAPEVFLDGGLRRARYESATRDSSPTPMMHSQKIAAGVTRKWVDPASAQAIELSLWNGCALGGPVRQCGVRALDASVAWLRHLVHLVGLSLGTQSRTG
ncbi:hypothetical protein MFU01_22250 [Myxococcus fulvus]|uniref:Uncharacterized protein n=1 Tax=Myxococcus fulvus TaxID=33 RepID=A0A511T1E0_MYXFU|nr:hypothetical protein MFU01_22250 [Myxococcus fulvus]